MNQQQRLPETSLLDGTVRNHLVEDTTAVGTAGAASSLPPTGAMTQDHVNYQHQQQLHEDGSYPVASLPETTMERAFPFSASSASTSSSSSLRAEEDDAPVQGLLQNCNAMDTSGVVATHCGAGLAVLPTVEHTQVATATTAMDHGSDPSRILHDANQTNMKRPNDEAMSAVGGPNEQDRVSNGGGTNDSQDPNPPSTKRRRRNNRKLPAGGGRGGGDGGSGSGEGGGATSDHNPFLPTRYACIHEPFARSFNDMVYELLKFRMNKGHVLVPSTHGMLGIWVYRMRVQWQALQRDPYRTDVQDLNLERIQVLSSLEFIWDWNKYQNDQIWNQRYQELVEYQRENGHCNVPQSCELGKWVKNQRDYYNHHPNHSNTAAHGTKKNNCNGKSSNSNNSSSTSGNSRTTPRHCSLTQDKIDKLEAIGFEWRLIQVVGWEQRFQELVEYKRLHGHTNVPTQTTGALGRWVSKQRIHMTYRRKGDYNQLSDERVEKLNSIGFVWNTKIANNATSTTSVATGQLHQDDMEPSSQAFLFDALQV